MTAPTNARDNLEAEMKMTKSHYKTMTQILCDYVDSIEAQTEKPISNHLGSYRAEGKTDEKFVFDVFFAARVMHHMRNERLYNYLNDANIATAVRTYLNDDHGLSLTR